MNELINGLRNPQMMMIWNEINNNNDNENTIEKLYGLIGVCLIKIV